MKSSCTEWLYLGIVYLTITHRKWIQNVYHNVKSIWLFDLNDNKSGEFKMTHQAPAKWWSLFSCMMSVVTCNMFSGHQRKRWSSFLFFGRTDVRTDTMLEKNDQLIRPWPWWANKGYDLTSWFNKFGWYWQW